MVRNILGSAWMALSLVTALSYDCGASEDCRVSSSPQCAKWRKVNQLGTEYYTDPRACERFHTCNLLLAPSVTGSRRPSGSMSDPARPPVVRPCPSGTYRGVGGCYSY